VASAGVHDLEELEILVAHIAIHTCDQIIRRAHRAAHAYVLLRVCSTQAFCVAWWEDRLVGGAVVHSATSNGNNRRDLLVVREH
jgi:hypothetical protein